MMEQRHTHRQRQQLELLGILEGMHACMHARGRKLAGSRVPGGTPSRHQDTAGIQVAAGVRARRCFDRLRAETCLQTGWLAGRAAHRVEGQTAHPTALGRGRGRYDHIPMVEEGSTCLLGP